MTPSVAIGVISQVLALCGVVSIRMFLPVFLYFFFMRLAPHWPAFLPELPEIVRQMAEHTPAWQTSSAFLTVLGILAALELAAMRNPDIKEFLQDDFDRYAKTALSILLACGVMNTAQALEVRKLVDGAAMVQTASIGGFGGIMALAGGSVTWYCCRVRSRVLEIVQSIDPDDNLRLQSLSNYLGEIMLVTILFVVVILPPLALVLTVIGMLIGVFLKQIWARYERRHSHSCAACADAGRETAVSDCATICPECGAEQPDVRRVGWFGFSGSAPLADMPPEQHAFRLLAAHRCRWCASPLDRDHACPRCGRDQWTDELQDFYVRQTDIRSGLLMSLTIIPFVGTLLALIFFRPLAVRPLAVHLSVGGRFATSLMMTFLKLLLLIPLIILSAVPLLGLLVLVPRYLIVRKKFLHALAQIKENGIVQHGKQNLTAP
jgi:hypothetical protein